MSETPRKKYHLRTIFHEGNEGKIGADGRAFGYVEAWHRKTWEFSPYCVANELICGEIGRFLRLQIPPFGITVSEANDFFFTSLNFNFGRSEEIPPIQPDLTWQNLPHICTGVLLFDIPVANSDRHDKNLAVDSVSKPKSLLVFDHDQALFGGGDPNLLGIPRLTALETRLGISNGTVTGGNRHCLLDEIDTARYVGEWCTRIAALPDWFIHSTCQNARSYGLSSDEADRAAEFLLFRRNNIDRLLSERSEEFSKITDWPGKGALL